MPHIAGNGAILGIVSEEGVVAQKRVTLMDRSSMSVVRNTVSDEFGAYHFTGLNADTDDYIVLCVDDDGNPKKSAIIFDYVQPIPAHKGGFFWQNWFVLSNRKEPMVSVVGISDIKGANLGYNSGTGFGGTYYGGTPPEADSLLYPMVGAADLPYIILKGSRILKGSANHKDILKLDQALSVSCEWVIRPNSVIGSAATYLYRSERPFNQNGGSYSPYPLLGVSYDAETGVISVSVQKTSMGSSNSTPPQNSSKVLSYTLPTELRGDAPIHIASSATYGGSANLYVNGVLVSTGGLTSFPAKPEVRASQFYINLVVGSELYLSASSQVYTDATYHCYLAAYYSEPMTEQEALSLYESLFLDTLPLVTGYERAVISNYPQFIYRLNEPSGSEISIDSLRPYAKTGRNSFLTNSGLISSTPAPEQSLVLGGVGKMITGNWYAASETAHPIPTNRYAQSVSFFAQPIVSSIISGGGAIIQHKSNESSSVTYFRVAIYDTGKIRVEWLSGGVAKSHVFSHIVDGSSVHHYCITLDLFNSEIKLYIDSELIEEAPALGVMDVLPQGLNMSRAQLGIGYRGYLSEVAAFPSVLTKSDIQNHYESRLTI